MILVQIQFFIGGNFPTSVLCESENGEVYDVFVYGEIDWDTVCDIDNDPKHFPGLDTIPRQEGFEPTICPASVSMSDDCDSWRSDDSTIVVFDSLQTTWNPICQNSDGTISHECF